MKRYLSLILVIVPLLSFAGRPALSINSGFVAGQELGLYQVFKAMYSATYLEGGVALSLSRTYISKELFLNFRTRKGEGSYFYAGVNSGLDNISDTRDGGGDGYHYGLQIGTSQRLSSHIRFIIETCPRIVHATLTKYPPSRYALVGIYIAETTKEINALMVPVTLGFSFHIGREHKRIKAPLQN